MKAIPRAVANGLKQRLDEADLPPTFFASWEHCSGSRESVYCHSIGLGMLSAAVADLAQVDQVAIDVRLKIREARRTVATWQPDVVGFRRRGERFVPVVYADLETPNSSDARVPGKDIEGYRAWLNSGGQAAPYVLLVCLPDWPQGYWPLNYTSEDGCNAAHAGKLAELRELGPLEYWTTAWREELDPGALDDVTILNVGNGKVERIRLFG